MVKVVVNVVVVVGVVITIILLIIIVIIITENPRTNRTIITRKQKWEEKQLYGRFNRLISNISKEKTWMWLRKGNLKKESESLLIAA